MSDNKIRALRSAALSANPVGSKRSPVDNLPLLYLLLLLHFPLHIASYTFRPFHLLNQAWAVRTHRSKSVSRYRRVLRGRFDLLGPAKAPSSLVTLYDGPDERAYAVAQALRSRNSRSVVPMTAFDGPSSLQSVQ